MVFFLLMTSRDDFESAPSIVQLFQSAKKLLALQPRVENRNLRKENYRMQQSIMSSEVFGNNNRVLELLSPLSIDEIKSSPPYAPKQSKNYPQNNGITEITPASVNDSPPASSSSKNGGDGWTSNSWNNTNQSIKKEHLTTIKKEPITTVTPLQIQSNHTQEFEPYIPVKHTTSNLTSSLFKEKNKKPKDSGAKVQCYNCNTFNTPLWRKDPDGNTLCNACGLFLKLHGSTRPLSLKTDVIKKRSSRKTSVLKIPSSNHSSRPGSFQDKTPYRPTYEEEKGQFSTSYNNSQNTRYKNVLILPKPPGGSAPSSTPSSVKTPSGTPLRSIPIPSSHNSFSLAAASPASFTGGSGFTVPNTPNSNQQFKRKKSEIGFEYTDAVRRGPTPGSYGSSFVKRTPSISSMQARSFQRKGSSIGLSTTGNGSGSLTFNNINLLNQRSAKDLNGGYFDALKNPPVGTPGSVTSHSSFSSLHGPMNNLNRQSFVVPSDMDTIGNAEMDALRSLPVEDADDQSEDYFKNFTLLQLHDDEMLDLDTSMVSMGNKYEVNRPTTKSTLTSGLRVSNGHHKDPSRQELKDLDWLKFEI